MLGHATPLHASSFNRHSRLIRLAVIALGVAGLIFSLGVIALAAPGDLNTFILWEWPFSPMARSW
jgi:hypothetical protein